MLDARSLISQLVNNFVPETSLTKATLPAERYLHEAVDVLILLGYITQKDGTWSGGWGTFSFGMTEKQHEALRRRAYAYEESKRRSIRKANRENLKICRPNPFRSVSRT